MTRRTPHRIDQWAENVATVLVFYALVLVASAAWALMLTFGLRVTL